MILLLSLIFERTAWPCFNNISIIPDWFLLGNVYRVRLKTHVGALYFLRLSITLIMLHCQWVAFLTPNRSEKGSCHGYFAE